MSNRNYLVQWEKKVSPLLLSGGGGGGGGTTGPSQVVVMGQTLRNCWTREK